MEVVIFVLGFKRGKALFLSAEHVNSLLKMWLSDDFEQEAVNNAKAYLM